MFFCESVVCAVGSQLPVMFSADRKTSCFPACACAGETRKCGLIIRRPAPAPAADTPFRKSRLLVESIVWLPLKVDVIFFFFLTLACDFDYSIGNIRCTGRDF